MVKYEELSACKIREFISKNKALLLYFGSVEQHGPHLPVGTDYICIEKRVIEIAKKSGSICFSPIKIGYSFNHIGMDGTISISSSLYIEVVKNVCLQLLEQGWKRILIFSGHNGNWDALRVATQSVKEVFTEAQIILAKGYPKMNSGHNKNRFFTNFDFHAGAVETALINYYRPELIEKLPASLQNIHIPKNVKNIIDKEKIDTIDELLVSGLIPQHTNKVSRNGIWGRNDVVDYKKIPVKEAMDAYIKFYVELINRWERI